MGIINDVQCPHCKEGYHTPKQMINLDYPWLGKPFVVCKKCGKEFLNENIAEPALKYDHVPTVNPLEHFIGNRLALLIVGIGCLVANPGDTAWFGLVWLALYAASVVLGFTKTGQMNAILAKKYEDSVERLKNPDYVARLKKAGYHKTKIS